MKASEITEKLAKEGIKVTIGHSEENIEQPDLLIYSPAIPESNPEFQKARKMEIKCQSYPEALGEFSKNYFTIAIAGTHGKSTTTAMTSLVLEKSGLDPTVIIGTKMKEFENQNYRIGESKYLVVEACEYKGSFQNLKPNILVITNIEADHLDFFKTEENYIENFKKFVSKLDKDSIIIVNDNSCEMIVHSAKGKVIGFETAHHLSLKIPGDFNKQNAAAVEKVAEVLNLDKKITKEALENFEGTWRRMEYKKKIGDTQFIDDYGHHPTEIKVTLQAIREHHPHAKILCVFQPHQYSRTKFFLTEFGKAFGQVDKVIIPNIYQVRDSEEDIKSVSTDKLVAEINTHQKKAINGNGIEETAKTINNHISEYDIIVTMGAGNIEEIYKYF